MEIKCGGPNNDHQIFEVKLMCISNNINWRAFGSLGQIALFLFFVLPLSSQRGVSVLSPDNSSGPLTEPSIPYSTYAVIVGISDYQSPQIPDLQFADRDAKAFSNWLKSPAGGDVPEKNITTLINMEAKNANIVAALDGIIEKVDTHDVVYFYFSGHGDIETKTKNQLGFLLAYDSAPTNYKASAYSLYYLQDNIETFSAKNAKVIVIMDACHAGKLAGTSINGRAITVQNLSHQFGNEIKILSCQANELSIESSHWGGGRGVFSYFLIDGLIGLADKNLDKQVNLHEIDRFLGEIVPFETDPHSQIPLVIGNRQSVLAHVHDKTLEDLKIIREKERFVMMNTDSKGFTESYLSEKDSLCKYWLKQYDVALMEGNLLTPIGYSANDYYEKLIRVEALRPVHGLLRRNLAAALQNEPQQAINALLESDPNELEFWNLKPEHYFLYPKYLNRAIELLGINHYTAKTITAKQLFFQAYLLKRFSYENETNPLLKDSTLKQARLLLQDAISIENDAAYLYFALADTYRNTRPVASDSVRYYNQIAFQLSPTWLLPFIEVAYEFSQVQNNLQEAEFWLVKAQAIDPNSFVLLERLAWLKQWQGNSNEALKLCHKMIELKPNLSNGYATIIRTFWIRSELDSVILYSQKLDSMGLGSMNATDWLWALMNTRRTAEAIRRLDSVLASRGTWAGVKVDAIYYVAKALMEQGDFQKAKEYCLTISDSFSFAKVLILEGQFEIAEGILERNRELRLTFNFPAAYNAWDAVIKMTKGQFVEAEEMFKLAIHPPNGFYWDEFIDAEEYCDLYGKFLLNQNRYLDAKAMFDQANQYRFHHGWKGYYGLALLYAKEGNIKLAMNFLEKAIDNYYPRSEPILNEPLFEKLRKTKRFKQLMKKHFGLDL